MLLPVTSSQRLHGTVQCRCASATAWPVWTMDRPCDPAARHAPRHCTGPGPGRTRKSDRAVTVARGRPETRRGSQVRPSALPATSTFQSQIGPRVHVRHAPRAVADPGCVWRLSLSPRLASPRRRRRPIAHGVFCWFVVSLRGRGARSCASTGRIVANGAADSILGGCRAGNEPSQARLGSVQLGG